MKFVNLLTMITEEIDDEITKIQWQEIFTELMKNDSDFTVVASNGAFHKIELRKKQDE